MNRNKNKEIEAKRESDLYDDSSSRSFAITEEPEAAEEEVEPKLSRRGSSKLLLKKPLSLHFLRPLSSSVSSSTSDRRGCSDSCIDSTSVLDYQKKDSKKEQPKKKEGEKALSPPRKEKAVKTTKEDDDSCQQQPRRPSRLARQYEQRNLNTMDADDKGEEDDLSSGSDHHERTSTTDQPSNPGAFAVFPVEGGNDRVAPAAAAAAAAEATTTTTTTTTGRQRRIAHSAREPRAAAAAAAAAEDPPQPRRHTAPLLRQDEMRSILAAQVVALDSSITIHEEDELRTSEHQIRELQEQYDNHVMEMKQIEEQLKDMPALQRELTTLKASKAENVEANVAFTRTEFARQLWLQKKIPPNLSSTSTRTRQLDL